jgi:hypothetical protein
VDDQPRARLVDTLRQQGMQPQQKVVFLSDGDDTLRRLQQNIAPEAEHVLDWFHVAMRLTGQMIKSARTETATAEAKAASLERIKWLLWHGNAPDAVDDVECLIDDVTAELEDNPTSASLRKLAAALGEFATYIANNAGHIVHYGERFRAGERISTGFVESAIIKSWTNVSTNVNRCAGRLGVHTCCFRPERASSTTISIKSSAAVTPPSGDHRPPTLPPCCDGLQLAAYSDSRIRRVYAFDPSMVTGYYSVDPLHRDQNVKGLCMERVYEHGEILAYGRYFMRQFIPLSPCNPRVVSIRFHVIHGSPIAQHSLTDFDNGLLREARGYQPETSPMVEEPCGVNAPVKPLVAAQ